MKKIIKSVDFILKEDVPGIDDELVSYCSYLTEPIWTGGYINISRIEAIELSLIRGKLNKGVCEVRATIEGDEICEYASFVSVLCCKEFEGSQEEALKWNMTVTQLLPLLGGKATPSCYFVQKGEYRRLNMNDKVRAISELGKNLKSRQLTVQNVSLMASDSEIYQISTKRLIYRQEKTRSGKKYMQPYEIIKRPRLFILYRMNQTPDTREMYNDTPLLLDDLKEDERDSASRILLLLSLSGLDIKVEELVWRNRSQGVIIPKKTTRKIHSPEKIHPLRNVREFLGPRDLLAVSLLRIESKSDIQEWRKAKMGLCSYTSYKIDNRLGIRIDKVFQGIETLLRLRINTRDARNNIEI